MILIRKFNVSLSLLCLLVGVNAFAGPGAGTDWQRFQEISRQLEKNSADPAALAELAFWKTHVEEKLDRGFYIGDRRSFFLDVLKETSHPNTLPAAVVGKFQKRAESLLKLPFEKEFRSEEHAQNHANEKLDYISKLQAKRPSWIKIQKHTKWKERASQIYDSNDAITREGHEDLAATHHIDTLWNKRISGKEVLIGLLETDEENSPFHADIERYVTETSMYPTSHGTSMVGVVASDTPTVFDQDPIAPEAWVHVVAGNEDIEQIWFRHSASNSKIEKPRKTSVSYRDFKNTQLSNWGVPQPYLYDYDLKYKEKTEGATTAAALQSLLTSGTKIIAIPRTLGGNEFEESKAAVLEYVRGGGLFVKGMGNSGIGWNLDYAFQLMEDIFRVEGKEPFHDYGFYKWLNRSKNKEIRDAFIFASNLDVDGKTLHLGSDAPGSFGDRAVVVRGSGLDTFFGKKGRTIGHGTSYSTMVLAGVFALLREDFPECSGQLLIRSALETAEYQDLKAEFGDQSSHKALDLDPTQRSRIFGRGKLNAERAYEWLEKYCPGSGA